MLTDAELTRLVEEHQKNLFTYCRRELGNDAELAKDLVGEIALLLVEKRRELTEGNMAAWLYKSAALLVRRERRKKVKNPAVPLCEADAARPGHGEERAAELLAEILDALKSKGDRLLFELAFVECAKYSEIALALGINEAAVKKRVSRLRKKIKENFK